jgi:hypothetical protein
MTQSSRPSNSLLLTLFAFLVAPATLLSAVPLVLKNPPVRPASSPVLIWDIDLKLANALSRNFRTTDEPLKAGNGTPATIGLRDLHASGSGEFTADNLKLLLMRMHGTITIFDLRQETQIFVNGLPVSWFATRDWANAGRSQTEIEEVEAAWVQSLGPGSEIAVRPGHAVSLNRVCTVVQLFPRTTLRNAPLLASQKRRWPCSKSLIAAPLRPNGICVNLLPVNRMGLCSPMARGTLPPARAFRSRCQRHCKRESQDSAQSPLSVF